MTVRETFFSLPVADLERATRFYVAVFGATVSFASPGWSSLHVAGVRIGLFPGTPGRAGVHFVVDDVAAIRRAVERNGGTLGAPTEVAPGVVVTDGTDSEGNSFSLRHA